MRLNLINDELLSPEPKEIIITNYITGKNK